MSRFFITLLMVMAIVFQANAFDCVPSDPDDKWACIPGERMWLLGNIEHHLNEFEKKALDKLTPEEKDHLETIHRIIKSIEKLGIRELEVLEEMLNDN